VSTYHVYVTAIVNGSVTVDDIVIADVTEATGQMPGAYDLNSVVLTFRCGTTVNDDLGDSASALLETLGDELGQSSRAYYTVGLEVMLQLELTDGCFGHGTVDTIRVQMQGLLDLLDHLTTGAFLV
jgi:hypothetical protein